MTTLYGRCILPPILHRAMRSGRWLPHREHVARHARGRVLEIGIGSGLNLPLYRDVDEVIGVDPCAPLLRRAAAHAAELPYPLTLIEGSAERLPLPEGSVDAVASTWTLCSIPDHHAALREIRRVLRPGGRFVFAEHGAAERPAWLRWQERLTPLWRRLAGGCHLDRKIDDALCAAGFDLERMEIAAEAPRPLLTVYRGVATPRSA